MKNNKPGLAPHLGLIALGIGTAVIIFALATDYEISEVHLPGDTIIRFVKPEVPASANDPSVEIPPTVPQPSPELPVEIPSPSPQQPSDPLSNIPSPLPTPDPIPLAPVPDTWSQSPNPNSSDPLQTFEEVMEQTQILTECIESGRACTYGQQK